MSGIRDSTDTFMREKVKPYIDNKIGEHHSALERHKDETGEMNAETARQIKDLNEFARQIKETIVGKIPPDPNNPSMWQVLQEIIGWKKGVNKCLWVAGLAILGLIVKALMNGVTL